MLQIHMTSSKSSALARNIMEKVQVPIITQVTYQTHPTIVKKVKFQLHAPKTRYKSIMSLKSTDVHGNARKNPYTRVRLH